MTADRCGFSSDSSHFNISDIHFYDVIEAEKLLSIDKHIKAHYNIIN